MEDIGGNAELLTPRRETSAHVQVARRKRRVPDHVHQRLELPRADILRAALLPARLRLQRHARQRAAAAHYADAEYVLWVPFYESLFALSLAAALASS